MTGDLFSEPPVSLAMQIREVSRKRCAFRRERELALRERVYPRHIANGLLTREKAERQVAALRAALGTLRGLAK